MSEWQKVKISNLLKRYKNPVDIQDSMTYKRVTIRGKHQGIRVRDEEIGKKIGTKKQFTIKAGQFILSKIDARYGAFGTVSEELDGAIITGNFWAYDVNKTIIDVDFFNQFTNSSSFYDLCERSSSGITHRKYLDEKKFLSFELSIPNIDTQREIVRQNTELRNRYNLLLNQNSIQQSHLASLRQQILQDAISGKLTENWRAKNPDIEPASKLLKKIKAEKERLIAEKKIKKDKQLPPISVNEVPFEIHPQYLWTRVDDLFFIKKGKTGIKNANPGIYPLVVTAEERLTHNTYEIEGEAILIPMVSSTGHGHASLKRIHFQDGKFALGSILSALIPITPEYISAKFYYYFLNNFRNQLIVSRMGGAANVALTQKALRSIIVPVLPIAVQEKAVRLLESANLLEEKIKQNKQDAEMLMQSFLVEAFQQ